LVTVVPDRPGALAGLLRCVAEEGANVLDVTHLREGLDLHIRETVIRMVLQTDGREHGERVLAAVRHNGFQVHVEDSALGGPHPAATAGAFAPTGGCGAGSARSPPSAAPPSCCSGTRGPRCRAPAPSRGPSISPRSPA